MDSGSGGYGAGRGAVLQLESATERTEMGVIKKDRKRKKHDKRG